MNEGFNEHQPVLLHEVVKYLITDKNGIYIDATFGRGGHSQAILAELSATGRLIALDQDPQAQNKVKNIAEKFKNFKFVAINFAEIEHVCQELDCYGEISGILFDLGVSSPQLDEAKRGFSFLKQGPLDMRMNPNAGISAAAWLAKARENEIAWVLKNYGEERFAKRIARAIVKLRDNEPIATTLQLAEIIKKQYPNKHYKINPATRTFQAIRIFVNRELENLEKGLLAAHRVLKKGGRLAIISFHSLEDKIAKHFFASYGKTVLPKQIPILGKETAANFSPLTKKAVLPSHEEIMQNPRSRSAKLRIAEKRK
ncbi:MAG: 16S rRNA (cytosine(1402)-N(4))-methyltransferase RsmH [Pseudomonadota bacterium]